MRVRDHFIVAATFAGMGVIVSAAVAAVTSIIGLVSSWLALELGFHGEAAAAAATMAFIVGVTVVSVLSVEIANRRAA